MLLCYSCKESGGNQRQPVLRDHVCKVMVPLIEDGITHIPTASGSDCCDLPSIVVRLSDGHSQRNSQLLHLVYSFIILLFYLFIYLFSIPEIHQSGYRTCHYIAVGRVQNEARQ